MFILFLVGAMLGFFAGVVFHLWWVRPDFNSLKSRIVQLEDEKARLAKFALRDFDVKYTHKEY